MKIQVIGSGSMWTKYNSACYLIDDDIMIDFPNGACKYLYKLDIFPYTINNVVLTHFHGDHYFDMPFYILNKSKYNNKVLNIYCSKEGKRKINKIGNLAFPNSFKDASSSLNINYIYDDNFNIESYHVNKMLVNHGRMKPAYGYIFTKNNKSVGFTGDTSLCSSVELMSEKCDYLFCDCMFINGTKKHQGINDLEYLSQKHFDCIFIVSHLEDDTRIKLKKKNIKNIIVPEDGQIIEI